MNVNFGSQALLNYIDNDRALHERVESLIKLLCSAVSSAANKLAKEHRDWHDDPDAPDHRDYHAPTSVQFPVSVRHATVRALVHDALNRRAVDERLDRDVDANS